MTMSAYLVLAVILFVIGIVTVLTRRNAILMLMGVELTLNAANLSFVTFARMWGDPNGQLFAFFVMVVAAAEVVVGLPIVVTLFRSRHTVSADEPSLMRH
ncbi:MAG: NADH-quinone oxidoreductase subunit NuoK [Micrococcales bacterium]|nr:NADH-quinone oxidoreductase subunit NuoK [Micrococcales bacterium]